MFLETKKVGEAAAETWRQLLLDGADLIELVGHCKNALRDSDGRVCLIGSMNLIKHTQGDIFFANEAMRKALGSKCPITWNDSPERTGAEVIAMMRKVANAGL